MKITWKAGTMLYPLPAVLVTVGKGNETNLLTIAWTGIVNSDPAMTYISVRPERHSYGLLKKNMEFVINIPTENMLNALDFCGVRSGKNINKLKETGLETEKGDKIETPTLKQSPLALECKVKSITPLGSHDMFLAEIVSVRIDETLLNKQGVFDIEKSRLITYCHGFYFALGRKLGKFGFSVAKKKNKHGKSIKQNKKRLIR